MSERPSGTVTFLFTDIEGSTRLWQDQPGAMGRALERHDLLLRSCIEDRGGYVFKTVGDSFCAAFESAISAVNAVLALQLALKEEEWPQEAVIRVRAALHTGEAVCRDGDYFGVELSRVGRLLSAGHGGQILFSGATKEMVQDHMPADTAMRPMGEHRLRDLSRTEEVFQLEHKNLEGEFPALRTLDNLPNNLPNQLTSFVGREQELETLRKLFDETRLLSLTGVGGTGKTRLALQFAAELPPDYPSGVWFVELAAVNSPDHVAMEIARALGVGHARSPLDAIARNVGDRAAVITIDNCEHVLDAVATSVEQLLARCTNLKIITTGREALEILGEVQFQVPSLDVPATEQTRLETISDYASVSLLIDRIQARSANFEINEDNVSTVASICRQLDGIPLAIELAAAKAHTMPLEEIDQRLDDRFRLLTGGSRTAVPRQQALKALIDWSFDLLSNNERLVLTRLSVFSGGWTLPLAEGLCHGEGIDESDVADLLGSLISKSLVLFDKGRYRFLETIRQYSLARLIDLGEVDTWRDRHVEVLGEFSKKVFSAAEIKRAKVDPGAALVGETENNLAALKWSVANAASIEHGTDIAFYAGWSFVLKGIGPEVVQLIDELLAHESAKSSPEHYGRGLLAKSRILIEMYQFEDAAPVIAEARKVLSDSGDMRLLATCDLRESQVLALRGESTRALEMFDSILQIFEQETEPILLSETLISRADLLKKIGRYDEAKQDYLRALEVYSGNRTVMFTGLVFANLGEVARLQGNPQEAVEYHAQTLNLAAKYGVVMGMVWSAMNLACNLSLLGNHKHASVIFFASRNINSRYAEDLPLDIKDEILKYQAQTLDALSEEDQKAAQILGESMTIDSVVAYVRNALDDSDR